MAMWLLCILLSLDASFFLPATGEVVQSFSTCSQFFLDGTPPQLKPLNPARICQRYNNKYRFATMYDKSRRIPMYSAYKYQPGVGDRATDWMIEPQLALPRNHVRKSMEPEDTSGIDPSVLKKSQAVEQDYKEGPLYDKGHLTPPSHQPDQDSKDATFTLTNIVPQLRQLNTGEWRTYEENMMISTRGCLETYVIVGVVPGNKSINNRVNVPSHIWAAACCVLQKDQRKSWAVLAQNNEDKVVYHTLGELQAQLANLYGKGVDLFNNACNAQGGPQN